MSKTEFMEQLEMLLADIPKEEREEAVAYYYSYFEDAGVENEEKIIRELKSPEQVAAIIKADIGIEEEKEYTEKGYDDTRFKEQENVVPYTDIQEERAKSKNADNDNKIIKTVLLVILLVITAPVWMGLLCGIAGVLVGIIGATFGIMVALVACTFALYVSGIVVAGVGISMFVAGNFAAGMGVTGAGCILLALALLGTILCIGMFGSFIPWLVRGIISLCRRVFKRKEKLA